MKIFPTVDRFGSWACIHKLGQSFFLTGGLVEAFPTVKVIGMTLTTGLMPIPTRHAGYKFRSRLEARWAVFFDNMKTKYSYECEAVSLRHAWTGQPGRFNYWPDFYLPEMRLWVEVKPVWSDFDCWRYLDAAASFGQDHGVGMLLLGDIPDVYYGRTSSPFRLTWSGSDLIASNWFAAQGNEIFQHSLVPGHVDQAAADRLLAGQPIKTYDPKIKRALEFARSARFGWGGE